RMSHGWSEGRKKLLADGAVSGTVTDAPVVLGRSVPGLGGGIVAARTCAAPDHLGVFKFVMSPASGQELSQSGDIPNSCCRFLPRHLRKQGNEASRSATRAASCWCFTRCISISGCVP